MTYKLESCWLFIERPQFDDSVFTIFTVFGYGVKASVDASFPVVHRLLKIQIVELESTNVILFALRFDKRPFCTFKFFRWWATVGSSDTGFPIVEFIVQFP